MSPRFDLLELSQEALVALANAGFVKRSLKDLQAGLVPQIVQEADGTVLAHFDDEVETRLGIGKTLRDAQCSCPAGGMCRHRVMLVLAYQAQHEAQHQQQDQEAPQDQPTQHEPPGLVSNEPWSPAEWTDEQIAASVPASVIDQALKLAAGRPVVRLVASTAQQPVPGAQLEMSQVRFYSRSSLVHARCDCRQGSACAHVVLASWAFRLAQERSPGFSEITLEIAPWGRLSDESGTGTLFGNEAGQDIVEALQDWLWSLWRNGSAQPLLSLEASYARLQARLTDLAWTWVSDELEHVWNLLEAQERRSSRFDAVELLGTVCQLWGRVQAARAADAQSSPPMPARKILGLGQKGKLALDHLRLVPLGTELWRDAGQEGVSLVYADPDTQAVTVMEKVWPLNEPVAGSTEPKGPGILLRRVAGHSLKTLASGLIVTKAAQRRANGLLEIGALARQTSVTPVSPRSWDDLRPPLRPASLASLLQHLQHLEPASVRARQVGGHWHVVGHDTLVLANWGWDGAAQTLFAQWQAADNTTLQWRLPHQAMAPGAVDSLARALRGEWGEVIAVSGPVSCARSHLVIQPMMVMCAQRALVLSVESAATQALDLGSSSVEQDAAIQLLDDSVHMLVSVLRQGWRQSGGVQRQRLLEQGKALRFAGFDQCGGLMQELAQEASARNASDYLRIFSTLGLLLAAI